ncbi:hypothetical protein [Nostoc sp. CHAB 5715]|uniref:hypothetical protein n=1 Tax=Nostoc sp. CHAB 5715 TaxID=2780400 RepID=UPI001E49BEA0|nr:hypothetical protein [Nostoc sp. CHAB 5715]
MKKHESTETWNVKPFLKAANGDSSTSSNPATENQQAVKASSEAEETPVKSTRGKSKNQSS